MQARQDGVEEACHDVDFGYAIEDDSVEGASKVHSWPGHIFEVACY